MIKLGAAMLVWLVTAATAVAQPTLATHNGSLMRVTPGPDHTLTISYASPKPELLAIGVRPGTVLVTGQWVAPDHFVGEARVFNLVCGPIPYRVEGGTTPDGVLTLQGAQVRVDWNCRPIYAEWTANSVLVFEAWRR